MRWFSPILVAVLIVAAGSAKAQFAGPGTVGQPLPTKPGAIRTPNNPPIVVLGPVEPMHVETLSLDPKHNHAFAKENSQQQKQCPCNVREVHMRLGFSYGTNKSILGDHNYDKIARVGLDFDVSPLKGKRIQSARLTLNVDATWLGADNGGSWADPSSSNPSLKNRHYSCLAQIGTGKDEWWKYEYDNEWIDANVVTTPGASEGPAISVDVTSIVQGWANGGPNFGLVLIGPEENLNAFTENACYTDFARDHVKLDVQFR